MQIKNIKGNTFYIDTGNLFIPFYKINDEEIILLDTGWKEGEREKLAALFEEQGLKVAAIINTHSHRDHIGNNGFLKEKYNCITAMPALEALICSSAANLKPYFSSLTIKDVEEQFGYLICSTDLLIGQDQDSVTVCDAQFKVFHTPGHSPAHICIVTPDDVAYLGDALISHDVMQASKLPYGYSLSEDLKSKAKLHSLKADKYVLAHNGVFSDISGLIEDNIEFYKSVADKVYELIDGPMTLGEIMKTVGENFRIRVNTIDRYAFIERMLKPYIEYLCETQRLKLILEDGILKYTLWFSESKWKKYSSEFNEEE